MLPVRSNDKIVGFVTKDIVELRSYPHQTDGPQKKQKKPRLFPPANTVSPSLLIVIYIALPIADVIHG